MAAQCLSQESFLSLDYDRIISQWGDNSVFACDTTGNDGDALGELLMQLEDEDECSAWLNSDDDVPRHGASTSMELPAQAPPLASCAHPARSLSPWQPLGGAAPCQMTRGPMPQGCQPAQQAPSHTNRQPSCNGWWEGNKPGMPQADARNFYDMGAFALQMNTCRRPSSEAPCIVPDTSVPSPVAQSPNNSYGLVPQMASPFMCISIPVKPSVPTLPDHANDMIRLRQECLKRYRDKKARRMYTKMVRYQLRKINADKRPRIKGRFVKKTEEELVANGGLETVSKESDSMLADDCLSEDSV